MPLYNAFFLRKEGILCWWFFDLPKLAKKIISRLGGCMEGSNLCFSTRTTTLSTKDPTKYGFKGDRRAVGSCPPAVEKCFSEDLYTQYRMSILPGMPKPGSAKADQRDGPNLERGKSHVTLGTTMALIPKVFSDGLVGEIWKL